MASARSDRQKLLIYATVPEAAEHRAIMDIFVTAAEGYRSRLRPGDVAVALGALTEPLELAPEVLERRLVSLSCAPTGMSHARWIWLPTSGAPMSTI